MKFSLFQKRFFNGILILLLAISGIWTGKTQRDAFSCRVQTYSTSQAECAVRGENLEMRGSARGAMKNVCHSQARMYEKIPSAQKEYARIEKTGLETLQNMGRVNRGSRTEIGRRNSSHIFCLAGIPMAFYRHQIKISLKYCLAYQMEGAGWRTIISFIHHKDGAKG